MRIAFVGQVPKDSMYPEANEDIFDFDLENRRFAMSDGATESFDSKKWANILVKNYVKSPTLSVTWIEDQIHSYLAEFDLINLSWSKQAAFDRGSFATLIGLEFNEELACIEVVAIGDSFLALINETNLIDSYPYINAASFKDRPELLSTKSVHNSFLQNSNFYQTHTKTLSILGLSKPIILCMTDALGEWAITQHEKNINAWERLVGIKSLDDLNDLVTTERALKNMKVDDVTLLQLIFE